MKLLSVLAVVAALAAHVDHAVAAPMGVIVVASDRHLAIPMPNIPVDGDDPLRPYRIAPQILRPFPKIPEGGPSAWSNVMMPGPQINVTPMETTRKHCGLLGRNGSLARSFHYITNKLRAALGFPVIHHYRAPEWHKKHYRLKLKEDGTRVVEEVREPSPESFFTRFEHAMRSLSPRESWAVTFVLGCGLGALLRMFVVLAIVFVRGRRGRSGCLRKRCRRRHAETPVSAPIEAAPPAYTDEVDEKPKVSSAVESPTPTVMEIPKQPEELDLQEIVTVERAEGGILMVYWTHVDGSDRVSSASVIHEMYPDKLLAFYEANLKWKPAEREVEDVVEAK